MRVRPDEIVTFAIILVFMIVLCMFYVDRGNKTAQIQGLQRQLRRTQKQLVEQREANQTYKTYLNNSTQMVEDKYNNGSQYIVKAGGRYYYTPAEQWATLKIGGVVDTGQLQEAEVAK